MRSDQTLGHDSRRRIIFQFSILNTQSAGQRRELSLSQLSLASTPRSVFHEGVVMKRFIFFALLLTSCAKHSSSVEASRAPAIVPVAPAISITWPRADAAQTSTYSAYSCSILNSKGVACYDGAQTTYTQPVPYTNEMDEVLVADGIICAIADSIGSPVACTDLTDPTCTNPPTSAQVLCWTPTNTTPVLMHIAEQAGYDAVNYNSGPLSLSASGAQACITASSFDAVTNLWVADSTRCGTTIQAGGGLQ